MRMNDLFGLVPAAEFIAFWKAYPKRKGTSRVDAYRAWSKVRRSASCEDIMEGLAKYPFNPDPQFQPHASTWLRQGRWIIEEDSQPITILVPEKNPRPSKGAWMEGFGTPGMFIDADVGDD